MQTALPAEVPCNDQLGAWVSVAERKPAEYRTVLVGITGVPWPITAFWTGERWCGDVTGDSYHPTHWMPLPAGPQTSA